MKGLRGHTLTDSRREAGSTECRGVRPPGIARRGEKCRSHGRQEQPGAREAGESKGGREGRTREGVEAKRAAEAEKQCASRTASQKPSDPRELGAADPSITVGRRAARERDHMIKVSHDEAPARAGGISLHQTHNTESKSPSSQP